jgi:hypothetical protein
MWIGICATVVVYFFFYLLEVFFNLFSLSPVMMDAMGIGVLTRQQERQFASVRDRLSNFSEDERIVLKFILDNGRVRHSNLTDAGISSTVAFEAIRKARSRALIIEIRIPSVGLEELIAPAVSVFQINPTLESALTRFFDQPSHSLPVTKAV